MITLNPDTGYYQGRMLELGNDNTNVFGDCVPVALANYLMLKKIRRNTIDDIVQAIFRDSKYIKEEGAVTFKDMPSLLNDVLKDYFNNEIHVHLYHFFSFEEQIGGEHKEHFTQIRGKTMFTYPAIMISSSRLNEGGGHVWTALKYPGIGMVQINNDGHVYQNPDEELLG